MTAPKILAVDDEELSLLMLENLLADAGFAPLTATSGAQALALLEREHVDLLISDLIMEGMDGLELLDRVRERYPKVPVIVVTARGSVESAVEAMRRGAYDYLAKPFNPEVLRITLQRALDYHHVVRENEQITGLLRERFTFQSIVTVNPAMKKLLELAARVAAARQTTVAIYGESGSGKEVLARAIHYAGKGLPAGFVAVNCAAVPEHLLESELFGHVRGAFTGADRDREGKFNLARGGTLLLDEIGDMPLPLQAKLLRVLQERMFEKIGSNTPISTDCRVIVATNRNLADMVAAGRFREDLYHRINVFPLVIPPLRERTDDIPLLCEHVLDQLRQHLGKPLPGISQKAMDAMLAHGWPGNVRELRNCLERAAILTDGELIRPEHLGFGAAAAPAREASAGPAPDTVQYTLALPVDQLSLHALTERIMAITLERCSGNKSRAAQLLRIDRKAFYRG
ncbi:MULTISPECIES: sigma-54-dependent transcriptional regulator [Geobacter]|uniref:sigma-54-dependent transcriptional regulator n=1 Tax=Geobacter TaxID=28231 RepID=UPI0025740398|nr:sigma-54 dependent transcriptional regulator [Geobacter sulfurreducens]BEH09469.1 sigma-54 dependent transcriptional regulator [Geobacter sulfurreducens subsp. ethanolicus]BET57350.1 sigma-54 dependent transcriptional regulator [Geobacter sp. 60473]